MWGLLIGKVPPEADNIVLARRTRFLHVTVEQNLQALDRSITPLKLPQARKQRLSNILPCGNACNLNVLSTLQLLMVLQKLERL